MTTAHYQVLQYKPYPQSGEWVAVGIIVYSPQAQRLEFLKASRLDRVSALFPWADVDALRSIFLPRLSLSARLESLASHKAGELAFGSLPNNLSSLSAKLIPANDNALQWAEEQRMRGESFEWICGYLEDVFFNRHVKDHANSATDNEVWRNSFKPSVNEVVRRFEKDKTIAVREREFHFDYAKQNGSLHLIDPASFALAKTDSITRKLDRRFGKYTQIAQAKPDKAYTIHVPAGLPEDAKQRGLIIDTLQDQLKASNMEVWVYGPERVGELKRQLMKALDS